MPLAGVALLLPGSADEIAGTRFADAHEELRSYPPGDPRLLGHEMDISVSDAGDVNADAFADIAVALSLRVRLPPSTNHRQ